MATKSNAPLVLFGLFGVGTVVLLAAAGGGSPVQGAQRVGGLVQGQIGRFFSWAELTVSSAAKRLGLDNTPTPEAQQAMQHLVVNVLDPLRTALGRPVRITSGYRAPAVNQAVKGSPTSQHMKGEAVDMKADHKAPIERDRHISNEVYSAAGLAHLIDSQPDAGGGYRGGEAAYERFADSVELDSMAVLTPFNGPPRAGGGVLARQAVANYGPKALEVLAEVQPRRRPMVRLRAMAGKLIGNTDAPPLTATDDVEDRTREAFGLDPLPEQHRRPPEERRQALVEKGQRTGGRRKLNDATGDQPEEIDRA